MIKILSCPVTCFVPCRFNESTQDPGVKTENIGFGILYKFYYSILYVTGQAVLSRWKRYSTRQDSAGYPVLSRSDFSSHNPVQSRPVDTIKRPGDALSSTHHTQLIYVLYSSNSRRNLDVECRCLG